MKRLIKNITYTLLASGSLLGLNSCSDTFLDSEPTTSLTETTYYQTVEEAEAALVGCYDGIQTMYDGGFYTPVAYEVMSDNCFGGTGSSDDYTYQQVDNFDYSEAYNDDAFETNWEYDYQAIYRCNVLLKYKDQVDWDGDTDLEDSIIAQTRFIRAYIYFDMVRLWGNIPLVLEPTTENVEQADPDSVYTAITEDLLYAAEYGDETVSAGVANKWAAKSLLARVYLYYTGYYGKDDLVGLYTKSDALEGLEEVIASGNYSLIEDFANLWPAACTEASEDGTSLTTTYAGKDNAETVFAIKYNITSDYDGNTDGNHWLVMLGLRNQAICPYGLGWGACTVNPELYNAYDEADVRRDASIIDIDGEGLDFDNSGQREYTGYYNKKYTPICLPDGTNVAVDAGATDFQVGNYQDYVAIRYADVLLMAAELGSSNAQDYYDMVRERAGLSSKTVSTANILEERRLEFAFEGIRYWDLLRQGIETAANTIAINTSVYNAGVEEDKEIDASNIIATEGLQMIPATQISYSSGVLVQNDGWE